MNLKLETRYFAASPSPKRSIKAESFTENKPVERIMTFLNRAKSNYSTPRTSNIRPKSASKRVTVFKRSPCFLIKNQINETNDSLNYLDFKKFESNYQNPTFKKPSSFKIFKTPIKDDLNSPKFFDYESIPSPLKKRIKNFRSANIISDQDTTEMSSCFTDYDVEDNKTSNYIKLTKKNTSVINLNRSHKRNKGNLMNSHKRLNICIERIMKDEKLIGWEKEVDSPYFSNIVEIKQ